MAAKDSTPITIKMEVEQRSGEWHAAYVVGSDLFPAGKGQARVEIPQAFNSRDEAVQHGVHEWATLIGEQVGAPTR